MCRHAPRAAPDPWSGRCRSGRTGRRLADGRCAPRIRPSHRVRPCPPPADRRGTRLRAAASVAAPRASRRESVSPPSVDTTIAWMRSPTATSRTPSSSFSSAISISGLALAADVDERHLRADRDDRALDGLALLDALRLESKPRTSRRNLRRVRSRRSPRDSDCRRTGTRTTCDGPARRSSGRPSLVLGDNCIPFSFVTRVRP